jgi:hypothetical protein
MNNRQLLKLLLERLRLLLPAGKSASLVVLALLVLSLAQSPNCHLATLTTVWPVPGKRENLTQRLRRWLKNPGLHYQVYYAPLVRRLLANWQGAELPLVMDRTDLNDRWSLLMLTIPYRKRALPLAWFLLPYGSTSEETQIKLLRQVQSWLPKPEEVRIIFLGDAEFRAVGLQRHCKDQTWHWQIGVKGDTCFRQANSDWKQLQEIPMKPGQRRYLQAIYLTKEHDFGPVNLIVDWNPNEETPRYTVLDQEANRHAWRRGRKRFWIEPFFRDWKSYGFDLENSKLKDKPRIENLILGMAITSLWMIFLGEELEARGERTLLEAEHKQDYSLFRLGRDWLRRSLSLGQPVPVGFMITH